MVADRPAKSTKPVAGELTAEKESSRVETLVEKVEESGAEILTSELDPLGEEDEPRRLRRLITLSASDIEEEEGGEVGGVITQLEPDPSVVRGEESELEAGIHSEVGYDLCFNVVPSPTLRSQTIQKMEQMQQMDQLNEQSRSTGSISVGGDVGDSPHKGEEREGERRT